MTGALFKVIGHSVFNKSLESNTTKIIEQKYESSATQDALRKEVKKEFRDTGRTFGKATKSDLKKTVADRTNTRIQADRATLKGVSKSVEMTGNSVTGLGFEKLTTWVHEKK